MLTCLISPPPRLTGSRLFYPDVKPTHANYQLSRNAAPRLMTMLYNLMRSERAIGQPSGRFLGASLHIRAAEKPSVSCSEAEISFLSLPWSISAYSAPAPSFLDAGLQTPPGFCPRQVSQRWPVRTSSLLWVFPPCTVRYWVFTTQCIHSCLNEVISLGILCRQA